VGRRAGAHAGGRAGGRAGKGAGLYLLLEYELDALGVAVEREIETAEAVARERVGAALQHNGARLVDLHDLADDGLEDGLVRRIVHTVPQRTVDRVPLGGVRAVVGEVARAREEGHAVARARAELVEGDGHHAVGRVEGLLDAVAVVDVDVDVEHSLVELKELEDGEHDVVGEAEARGFGLLGVVQPARPIDRDVRLALVELRRAAEGASDAELAKVVDTVKPRAVLADVEPLRRECNDRVSR
jgi:hypothetical protein